MPRTIFNSVAFAYRAQFADGAGFTEIAGHADHATVADDALNAEHALFADTAAYAHAAPRGRPPDVQVQARKADDRPCPPEQDAEVAGQGPHSWGVPSVMILGRWGS